MAQLCVSARLVSILLLVAALVVLYRSAPTLIAVAIVGKFVHVVAFWRWLAVGWRGCGCQNGRDHVVVVVQMNVRVVVVVGVVVMGLAASVVLTVVCRNDGRIAGLAIGDSTVHVG